MDSKSNEHDNTNKILNISDISDSVIQKFLLTKKYKYSVVNIALKKEKYKSVETCCIGTDVLIRDFVEFVKNYH